MLAGDPAEAVDKAEEFLKEKSLSAYYDEVALPGLKLAQNDVTRGSLDPARIEKIRDAARELVDDLADYEDRAPEEGLTQDVEAAAAVEAADQTAASDLPILSKEELAPEWKVESPVLCTAGRTGLDEAAATMLGQLLGKHGIVARIEGVDAVSISNILRLDSAGIVMVCLSCLDTTSAAHIRYVIRRLRRRMPQASILLACWTAENAQSLQEAVKADAVATTLREAVRLCVEAARLPARSSEVKAPQQPIGRVGAAAS
jgi:hypothetical protein